MVFNGGGYTKLLTTESFHQIEKGKNDATNVFRTKATTSRV
jgi:hypothetical protein